VFSAAVMRRHRHRRSPVRSRSSPGRSTRPWEWTHGGHLGVLDFRPRRSLRRHQRRTLHCGRQLHADPTRTGWREITSTPIRQTNPYWFIELLRSATDVTDSGTTPSSALGSGTTYSFTATSSAPQHAAPSSRRDTSPVSNLPTHSGPRSGRPARATTDASGSNKTQGAGLARVRATEVVQVRSESQHRAP